MSSFAKLELVLAKSWQELIHTLEKELRFLVSSSNQLFCSMDLIYL